MRQSEPACFHSARVCLQTNLWKYYTDGCPGWALHGYVHTGFSSCEWRHHFMQNPRVTFESHFACSLKHWVLCTEADGARRVSALFLPVAFLCVSVGVVVRVPQECCCLLSTWCRFSRRRTEGDCCELNQHCQNPPVLVWFVAMGMWPSDILFMSNTSIFQKNHVVLFRIGFKVCI